MPSEFFLESGAQTIALGNIFSLSQKSQKFLSSHQILQNRNKNKPTLSLFDATIRWQWTHLGGSSAGGRIENSQSKLISVIEPHQHDSDRTGTVGTCWLWTGNSHTKALEQLL